MPDRRRATFLALAAALTLALAACGQPVDPATRTQDFSFGVANPGDLTGSVFGVVYEAFGTYQPAALAGAVSPAQATAIRDAMPGATLSAAGTVTGTLMPVAQLSRINEILGFELAGEELYFVPEGCDVTATNATEAAFATPVALLAWNGTDLDPTGFPATPTAELVLEVVVGDVTTLHYLAASKSAWSAVSDGPCESSPTSSYVLDLDVAVGWQFLRVTIDASGPVQLTTVETRTLDQVADAGDIGAANLIVMLDADAPHLTPLYR